MVRGVVEGGASAAADTDEAGDFKMSDSEHAEIMQQMATQRDEEHHTRLVDELEAVEAENKVGGWVGG